MAFWNQLHSSGRPITPHMNLSHLVALNDQLGRLSPDELALVMQFGQQRLEALQLRNQIASAEVADEAVMRKIRDFLAAHKNELRGADAVLCAAWHVVLSGSDVFNARQVNSVLDQQGAKPANISSVMEALHSRALIALAEDASTTKHKRYCLTEGGRVEAQRILSCDPTAEVDL